MESCRNKPKMKDQINTANFSHNSTQIALQGLTVRNVEFDLVLGEDLFLFPHELSILPFGPAHGDFYEMQGMHDSICGTVLTLLQWWF